MIRQTVPDDGSARVVLGITKTRDDKYSLYDEEIDLRDDQQELQNVGWTTESEVANAAWKNKG